MRLHGRYCSNAEHTYFGATIGRIANRVKNCEFPLDGKTYKLSCNEKEYDTIHGGEVGFDRRVWTSVHQTPSSVTWAYSSPDGEMGFPGDLAVNVTHTITEDNTWEITYSATTETKTVVAMTNHAYFNLNANIDNTLTVVGHTMSIPTGKILQQVTTAPDYHLIATGKSNPIDSGSVWDFYTKPKLIGEDIDKGSVTALGGYDNAWIFSDWKPGMASRAVVTVESPKTGIKLVMKTDQPSVQIYTGNFLNGTDPALRLLRKKSQSFGSDPQYYHWRGAFTLEAQQWIDAVNNPDFPSVVIEKGNSYSQSTAYSFSVTA
jgi:aldose 1-epimerase